jgi:predicted SprT family Zn-dependent metalloprotease
MKTKGVVTLASSTLRPPHRWLSHFADVWMAPDVRALAFRVNSRLTRTLARCLAQEGVIEVSTQVRLGDRSAREVVAHEAAHFVVARRHGRAARPHGAEWRALMQVAGFEPVASKIRCGDARTARRAETVFVHRCAVCSFSRRARRRVSTWRCPECTALGLDGVLAVERVGR